MSGGSAAARDLDPVQPNAVGAQRQVLVVSRAHRRQHDAELHGELAAQGLDATEQVSTHTRIDEVDDVVGQAEFEGVDADLLDEALGGLGSVGAAGDRCCTGSAGERRSRVGGLDGLHATCDEKQAAADEEERNLGQAGDARECRDAAAGQQKGALLRRELADHVRAHVAVGRCARDDKAGGDGEHQGWDLRDETVTDGQEAVVLHGGGEVKAALEDADGHATEEIDDRDDDGRDRVALDELRTTVHRSVEVGLGGDLLATTSSLSVVDEAGVEVGVDGHLLAGHGVQREAGADLGHTLGALGDDDELDDDQDEEDDQADDDRAADDEVAEGFDH